MSDVIVIKAQDAYDLLEQVVDEKGRDFVYKKDQRGEWVADLGEWTESVSCFYVEDDCPSCVVGHAAVKAGISVEDVVKFDGDGIKNGYSQGVHTVSWPDNVRVTDRALKVLSFAQVVQDQGGTWGEALDFAKTGLEYTDISDEIEEA